jgi:hypothetical protein
MRGGKALSRKMSEGFAARRHQRRASFETRLAALLRMRKIGSGITNLLILRGWPEMS